MKAIKTIIAALVIMMGSLTANAQCMSITAVRNNARFLTDRMAYTLGISDPFLIDEIYRINYDYIWGVNSYLDDVAMGYYYDDYISVCSARDIALRTLLGNVVWNRVIGYSYFYRPIVFANRCWHFSIYDYDRHGRGHFFLSVPRPYNRGYEGGHFFRGMAPRDTRGNMIPPRGYRQDNGRYDRPGNVRYNNGRGNVREDINRGGSRVDNGRSRVDNNRGRVDNNRGNGRTYDNRGGSRIDNGRGNSRNGGSSRGNVSAPSRSSGFIMTRSDNNMRSSSRVSATRVSDNSGSRGGGNSRGGGVVQGGRR